MPLTSITSKTAGWLLVVLLVITFALGAMLTMVVQDRNQVKQVLKETKQELRKEKAESQQQEQNFNGCVGKLSQLQQNLAGQAQQAKEKSDEALLVASNTMAKLPTLIKQDRAVTAKPAEATAWLKGLFQ